MAEKNIYEVERILGKREIKGYVEYFIRWKGFSTDWDTWEPAENLSSCKDIINHFEEINKKTQAVKKEKIETRQLALKLVKKSKQSKGLSKLDKKTKVRFIQNGPSKNNNEKIKSSSPSESKSNKCVMKKDKAATSVGSGKKEIHRKQTPRKKSLLTQNKTANKLLQNSLMSSKKSFNTEQLTLNTIPIILKKSLELQKETPKKNINANNVKKDVKPKTLSPKTLAQNAFNLQSVLDQVAKGTIGTFTPRESQKTKHGNGPEDKPLSAKKLADNRIGDKNVVKKAVKRKSDSVENDQNYDSDVLYSIGVVSSSKHKTKQVSSLDKTNNGPKKVKTTVILNHKRQGKCTENDSQNNSVKGKAVRRVSSEKAANNNCKKPRKQLSLLDGMNAMDPSSSVPRPVAPLSLYTSVKSISPVLAQPSAGPSMMDAYFGEFPSFQMRSSVIPLSPSSISYKALLDNLPHQLHLKNNKNKKSVQSEADTVERRVSVRSTECAFRYKEIVVKKCQGYTQIWLNTRTSQKNAINPQVVQEIVSALNSAKYDDSKLVMFSSIGNVFCSGVDLNFLTSEDRKITSRQMADAVRELTKTFITFPKPVVATVTGPAIGLGMAILPLCDVVYTSDKALFHLPYTQLCQTPEGCISYTLPQAVGPAMSSELLFASRKITALEAHQLGLVSQVFWPTSLMQEVIPRVQYMAMHSAKAMEATKLLIRSHQRTKLELTNETECNLLMERWSNGECQRAIEAYLSDDKNLLI